MKDITIIRRLHKSLNELIEEDFHLLEHNLSEQSIAHKLAEKLQYYFSSYDVDCEYNGNVFEDNGRKQIAMLKSDLTERGIKRTIDNDFISTTIRSCFPDIIIHKRGSLKSNLLIIEIKKSSNRTTRDYDELKLKAYTNDYLGNDLKYQLGVFLEINTTDNVGDFEIIQYKNGALKE